MKKLLLLFLGLSLLACSKERIDGGVLIDVGVGLHYINKAGNLFDSRSPVYKESDVKIYNITGGKEVLFSQGNLTYSGGFDVRPVDSLGTNVIYVFVNHELEGGKNTAKTIVRIGSDIVDTLTCQISKPNSASSIVTKVWLNGKLKWDISNPKDPVAEFGKQRAFTIYK
ncbi:hypothetical protein SAMN06265348_104448 [Pedobacter westerhofensis]|uniref:Lipoprotein n=1 Tax=Pedobacter westerhofensis TaxID=425512 RepID=A0A521D2V0_9SPHI|nr:hypothetical protein [Pedobacter westerhofensis]SMO65987.1 hypothetical protein SAMN06265348_104448 [Pedobacter westerhofensis]